MDTKAENGESSEDWSALIRQFESIRAKSLEKEHKYLEEYFPNESWEEYTAKIAETEANFAPAEQKYSDSQRQAVHEKFWLNAQRTKASQQRWRELCGRKDRLEGRTPSGFYATINGERVD